MLLNKICDQNFFFILSFFHLKLCNLGNILCIELYQTLFFPLEIMLGNILCIELYQTLFFSIKIYDKEIMIWQFSYHTPYQPSTPISALGPSALGLIWESRADTEVSG